ncbi:MAG: dihydrolipoyl dehydrogenase [Myxococcota bacterium]|nr:dihydrolipoyl dehydrogenase [Myxococcota bacterium]
MEANEMVIRSTREREVDVAVIGAGTAGLAAFRAASAMTSRALLVEGGVHGTTCARVGCMPSKLLIAAAEAAHDARHAQGFGVRATVAVDSRAVMQRVRSERDRFVGFVLAGVESIPEEKRLTGRARFVGPGVLDVEGTLVRARAVVLATGSSPVVPPTFSIPRELLLVNDDVFAWEDLPDSIAVIGAGVIGLELGQALHRLGVRVRILGRGGSVGPLTDPVVTASAAGALAAELGVDFDTKNLEVRREGDRVVVRWQASDGEARVESFSYVLAAAGRKPNLAGLDIERAGISLDERGLLSADRATARVGDTNVFLAGDAAAEVPLLHEAIDEGTIAGENAARFPDVHPRVRRSPLAIVFTDPQIAVAGESFARLSGRAADLVTGEVSFENQGRSRVMRKNKGAARVYADKASGRLLGAEMAGPRAEHIGHLLAWAHQQGMTIEAMLAMPFYHPVIEEGIRTALREASAKLRAA